MIADVTVSDGKRLTPHRLRAAVLGEVHARPFTPLETPRRILHFAFDTSVDAAKVDRAALADFCARRELEPLKSLAKQHRITLDGGALRWEQHSEFTTYPRREPRRSIRPPRRWPNRWPACRSQDHCWSRSTCICWRIKRR
jgi:uncharacterized membrane-anchored protein